MRSLTIFKFHVTKNCKLYNFGFRYKSCLRGSEEYHTVRLNHVTHVTSCCCASLVPAVYSFTLARRRQLGVADSLTAHSQLKRHGNAVVGRLVYFEGLDSVTFSSC
jgi:hypothetical protein